MNRTLMIAAVLLGLTSVGPVQADPIDFTSYHTPAQIASELSALAADHPSIAQVHSIGASWGGQPINALKISDNVGTDDPDEGDVVFVALHHAREWMAAETALYVAEYLVNTYAAGSDPALSACIDELEIWIIPVINPDGYLHTSTTSRYWRKNRRNNGDGTYGVDLNRNYGYQWGGGSGSEGSDITGDDTYRGPSAFSEPETQALRDFVQNLDHPRAMLSYHSYSELFLRPWAYASTDPPGETTLEYIAQDSIARMAAVHGHTYGETIWYSSFGETGDYFWHEMRLATFTPELRPADPPDPFNPVTGFSPAASEIIPNCQENLPAALALIRDAGCRKVWIRDHGADTGVEPSAVWTGGGWSHAFWVSPDIWTDPTELEEGSTVTLHVRVHNDTGATMSGSTVAAYWTDPRVILEFPALGSVLIGEQPVNLPPGDTVISFPWTVPTGTNIWGERHWCVGGLVYHQDDRPLTTQVERTSNIACKNFETVEATLTAYGMTLQVALENYLPVPCEYVVKVDMEKLPPGWEVILPELRVQPPVGPKARLLGVHKNVLRPGEVRTQEIRLKVPRDTKPGMVQDLAVHAALLPLVPGERTPLGNGYTFRVRVPDQPRK